MGSKGIRFKDNSNNHIFPCAYMPVGAIYKSTSSTNPSNFFDGTWTLVHSGYERQQIGSQVLHPGLSGKSFSQSGWPGTYIEVDPLNKINLSFLTNRTHSRVVSIDPSQRYRIMTDKEGVNFLPYKSYEIVDSSLYGFERRAITDSIAELAIQEKMLEELIGRNIDKVKEQKKLRIIRKET